MRALLESLLSFAGLQSELPFAALDLTELVEQVRADLAPRLEATGGRIEIAPLGEARGVRARLYQLFLNLAGNALKFARPGEPPHVRVFVEESDPAVYCVSDNGRGIAPADQERIFKAFQRLQSQTAVEGSGLGLAIVQQIVEQHRGKIWVRSNAGEGSTFCFTLGT
jgi:signal transduction histidine kinase